MSDITSVLFVCNLNSIRSPMAEGAAKKIYGADIYFDSCGVSSAFGADEIMISVMKEIDVDMSAHISKSLEDLTDHSFDLIICFTPAALSAAQGFFEDDAVDIEFWSLPDPSDGPPDVRSMMNNYRAIRSNIMMRLQEKLGSN